MSVLAVDVGTSGVRAAVVRPDSSVDHAQYRQVLPTSPAPGFVEFDARAMADAALAVATAALAAGGSVDAVGITNQRASTVLWDRATGEPVGPGIGWQDLRTAGYCLALQSQGIRLAPEPERDQAGGPARHRRSRPHVATCASGTVDTWVAWTLSEGRRARLRPEQPRRHRPSRRQCIGVGRVGARVFAHPARGSVPIWSTPSVSLGEAIALPGAPPIAGLAGDQQASLVGQGCVRPGLAKATFGTGGMLDLCVGRGGPSSRWRGPGGTFPIVAWSVGGRDHLGDRGDHDVGWKLRRVAAG